MESTTTISAILWKAKPLASGEYPIWLRITKNRARKYVALKISSSIEDWDEKKGLPKKSHPHKEGYDSIISKAIWEHRQKAIALTLKGDNFKSAQVSIKAVVILKVLVLDTIRSMEDRLRAADKVGSADLYKKLHSQLTAFLAGKPLLFPQVDFDFLVRFESWFRKRKLMDTYMSTYFRKLRKTYTEAIRLKIVSKELYPFDEYKISERFSDKTQKRAITKAEIKLIGEIVVDAKKTAFEAQKYFMFSYYGMGINFIDMADLKWENLVNGRIFYRRAKTQIDITFILPAPSLAIIEHFRPLTKELGSLYIFPIYNNLVHITEAQRYDRRKKVLKRVNKDLKALGASIGIETKITTYVARHTFATTLKNSGVSTAIISESMGHHSEEVTRIYLKSFEDSVIDDAMKNLL